MTKPIDIATDEQWEVVYDGMIGAVTQPGATAYLAFLGARYKVAGKTGTAQVFTIKQTESTRSTRSKSFDERRRDHAWFIAYAPADAPKIAVAVLVENGGFGGGGGGAHCTQSARRLSPGTRCRCRSQKARRSAGACPCGRTPHRTGRHPRACRKGHTGRNRRRTGHAGHGDSGGRALVRLRRAKSQTFALERGGNLPG